MFDFIRGKIEFSFLVNIIHRLVRRIADSWLNEIEFDVLTHGLESSKFTCR